MNWRLLRAYGEQCFIAFDQLLNALVPPIDGTVGFADETLSARCYRAHRDGKRMGLLFMRPIDFLFAWQGPEHCKKAYIKEFERKNFPDEYRAGVPIFEPRNRPRT